MGFLSKNKNVINILFAICIVIDFVISFIINLLSQDVFDIFATHNIILFLVLILLVIIYIIFQIIIRNANSKKQNKRLQKAFQENGGYEVVVHEMKTCIEKHDYKSIKELKKIVNYIER